MRYPAFWSKVYSIAIEKPDALMSLAAPFAHLHDEAVERLALLRAIQADTAASPRGDRASRKPAAAPASGTETPTPEAPAELPDLVTLSQAAAMVHRRKRTLERYKTKGKQPAAAVEGGEGNSTFMIGRRCDPGWKLNSASSCRRSIPRTETAWSDQQPPRRIKERQPKTADNRTQPPPRVLRSFAWFPHFSTRRHANDSAYPDQPRGHLR